MRNRPHVWKCLCLLNICWLLSAISEVGFSLGNTIIQKCSLSLHHHLPSLSGRKCNRDRDCWNAILKCAQTFPKLSRPLCMTCALHKQMVRVSIKNFITDSNKNNCWGSGTTSKHHTWEEKPIKPWCLDLQHKVFCAASVLPSSFQDAHLIKCSLSVTGISSSFKTCSCWSSELISALLQHLSPVPGMLSWPSWASWVRRLARPRDSKQD